MTERSAAWKIFLLGVSVFVILGVARSAFGSHPWPPRGHSSSGRPVVLVTGGLGMIGSVAVPALVEEGYDVIVMDVSSERHVLGEYASRVRFVQADIRDAAAVTRVMDEVDGLIHLAAMSRVAWCRVWGPECMSINVNGTETLLQAATSPTRHRPAPWVVFGSSREVFGGLPVSDLPVSENSPKKGANTYGWSKVYAEQVVQSYVKNFGITAVVIRFSNVYGSSKDHEDRVVPNFVWAALHNEPLMVSGGGKGVDFTYINDTVNSIVLAARRSRKLHGESVFEDYNIASGTTSDLSKVAEMVVSISTSKSHIATFHSDPEYVDAYSTTMHKSKSGLGYVPQVTMDQGLQLYIDLARKGLYEPTTAKSYRDMIARTSMLRLYNTTEDFVIPEDINQKKVVMIGGGICALCAAARLEELGHTNWKILEETDVTGGLARSETDDHGNIWDFGVHVLFSHFGWFDTLLDHAIPPTEWGYHVRGVKAFMRGVYVDYPVQNNLYALPTKEMLECIDGVIDTAIKHNTTKPANFYEWVLNNFGKGLAEIFLLPYNFKVWAHPAIEMNAKWVGERVATLDAKSIVKATLIKLAQSNWGPNAIFRYPINGTGYIWEKVTQILPKERMYFRHRVTKVSKRQVHLDDGSKESYDVLLSTIPMDQLLKIVDTSVRPTGVSPSTFKHQTVNSIGVAIRGPLPPNLRGVHWLYFPEEKFPFYRVTVLTNFSPHMATEKGVYTLLAEVSESKYRHVNQETVVEQVIQGYRDANMLLETGKVVTTFRWRKEYGYPVPYVERDFDVHTADSQLQQHNIWSRGRFGGWKYEVANQDHVCMQGVEAIDKALLGAKELEWFDPDLINGMYRPPYGLARTRFSQLPSVDVVVSHCTENLDWIDNLVKYGIPKKTKFTIYVYEKCVDASNDKWRLKINLMQDAMNHIQRITLPDVGYEAHTFLTHLLNHKDGGDATVFLRGDGKDDFEPSEVKSVIEKLLDDKSSAHSGFSFVSGSLLKFDNKGCPGKCELGGLLSQVYEALLEGSCPKRFVSRRGSEFAVTRRRIASIPRITWSRALAYVDGSKPSAARGISGSSQEVRQLRLEADIIEHLWHVMFGLPPELHISDGEKFRKRRIL
eukprot:TRINITY_DN4444_c0_g1_i4.p1 TRINITY_DN4444_c0_g1~~TRINITY_DN4444_c0_g1_i4.p1  ORF type:complete len:1115 (-),score=170.39 TRINITY_DN4444_c0_g1_i4:36-3380(-)